jgi:hypothetical protein
MLKSIIIAIVVAVAVWALSFDFFFAYKGTAISFAIAVAAGLVAGLILKALTPKVGIHIVVVAIVALGATFLASKLVHKEECNGVPPAKLSCGKAGVNPDCFVVNKNSTFTWDTSGLPAGATVTISKFKKKFLGIPLPADPLDAKSYTGNKNQNISAKVKNKSGYFKYSIMCSPSDIKDPMFKVP